MQAFLLPIMLLAPPARAVDITTCALPALGAGPVQTVPAKQTAVLQADLTGCHYAVALENGATLQMNGHVIRDCGVYAVVCLGRRCTIEGPGEITGGGCDVAGGAPTGKLQKMFLRDVNVHDTWGSVGGVRTRLFATNVTVTHQIDNPNAFGGSQVAVGGYGVVGTNLVATDNIGFGVVAFKRLRLVDSTVTGNNGFERGLDIESNARPHLVDTVCGRSVDEFNVPWGVCTNDAGSPSGAFVDPRD
jgi:hypothetical protein